MSAPFTADGRRIVEPPEDAWEDDAFDREADFRFEQRRSEQLHQQMEDR